MHRLRVPIVLHSSIGLHHALVVSHLLVYNHQQIHNANAISEVSKGDCIIMGDFNHGNIKWDSQQSSGVHYQKFLCLVHAQLL